MSHSFFDIPPSQKVASLGVDGTDCLLLGGRESNRVEYKLYEGSELVLSIPLFPVPRTGPGTL